MTDKEKVEKVRKEGNDVHYLSWVVNERDVIKLLQAERRAIARLIPKLPRYTQGTSGALYENRKGGWMYIGDILKALGARGKK